MRLRFRGYQVQTTDAEKMWVCLAAEVVLISCQDSTHNDFGFRTGDQVHIKIHSNSFNKPAKLPLNVTLCCVIGQITEMIQLADDATVGNNVVVALFPVVRGVQESCEVIEGPNIADFSVYEWIEQTVRHV